MEMLTRLSEEWKWRSNEPGSAPQSSAARSASVKSGLTSHVMTFLSALSQRLLICAFVAAGLFHRLGAEEALPPQFVDTKGRVGPITRLTDGRLFAVYGEGRPEDKWDDLSIAQNIYGRWSSDDGATWTEPKIILPMPPGPGAAACGVTSGGALALATRDGTIHLFGCRYYNMPQATPGNPPKIRAADFFKARTELWYTNSRDGGATWRPLRNIDYGHRYTGALNSLIQLRSGRLLLSFSYLSPKRQRGFFVSTALYSDDGGNAWIPARNDVTVDCGGVAIESGAPEPVSVELPDGRVWMVVRTQTSFLFQSYSVDGGETWSPSERTQFRAPNAPAGLLRLRDQRLVVVWNNELGEPIDHGVSYSRRSLVMAVLDHGRWHGYRELAEFGEEDDPNGWGGARYPYLLEGENGDVLVTYSEDERASRKAQEWVMWKDERLVRVDPRWLLQTNGAEDFSDGTSRLQLAGTKGVQVIQGGGGKPVLQMMKGEGSPCGATWNFPFGQSGLIHIRLRAPLGLEGIRFTLSESFPTPTNQEGGMFEWEIDPTLKLQTHYVCDAPFTETGRARYAVGKVVSELAPDQAQDVAVTWNCATNVAELTVDGQYAATLVGLAGQRGIAYLRVALTGRGGAGKALQVLGFHSQSQP